VNRLTCLRDWVHENYRLAYVLGTGALALAAWAVVPEASPFWSLGAWGTALALGAILEPGVHVESQLYGPVLSRGRTDRAVLALTFDDGPCPPHTSRILDVLAREKVQATFFCLGREVRRHPELVRRMVREGHLVGTHTENHCNLLFSTPGRSHREILEGRRSLALVMGQEPEWFRPPYGMRPPWTLNQARNLGMTTALWSNCPRDWQRPGAEVLARRVVDRARPGDVVLLHDGGGDRSQTVRALEILIPELRRKGLGFVRLDALAGPPGP
jgi:peptidoglycan/xylan/chitin deacetylase (PgdA/CDA1 family)